MGGRGSGRTSGMGLMVSKCNETHSIDIAYLHRHGLLEVGRCFTLSWLRRGQQSGSIRLSIQSDGIGLAYNYNLWGVSEAVNEIVPLTETQTQFGGRRQWFECMACGRRCRILYGGTRFRC